MLDDAGEKIFQLNRVFFAEAVLKSQPEFGGSYDLARDSG